MKSKIFVMKKLCISGVNIISLLLTLQYSFGQSIIFEAPTIITDKVIGSENFLGPVIPYDYNNDNYPDFFGSANASFIKNEAGNFVKTSTNCNTNGDPIKLVDFNSDGVLDYVNSRSININNGDGTFTVILSPDFNSLINDVVDIDKDGFMDIITGVYNLTLTPGNFSIWFNDGSNQFTETVLEPNYFVLHTAVEDINNDGNLDIIVNALDEVGIFRNQGSRVFTNNKPLNYNSSFNKSIMGLIDFDRDNDLDIVISRPNNGLATLENTNYFTSGSLSPKSTLTVDRIITFVIDDLNKDGDSEIILLNTQNSRIAISYATIKADFSFKDLTFIGEFAEEPSSYVKAQGNIMKNNISIFDYNFDGKKDIIYSDGFNMKIHLMLNSTPVGTEELETAPHYFTLFPNPVLDELNISSIDGNDVVSGRISSSLGNIMHTFKFNKSLSLDVSNYPKGSYVVNLTGSNSASTLKFIKN